MIDIRCHLLDGTKCGPEGFTESLEMCRSAAADGVRTIVATPRWEAGASEPPLPLADCHRQVEFLQKKMGDSLSIKLGFVMPLGSYLPALAGHYGSKLALGGGRYILISLPPFRIPEEAEKIWSELALLDFSVVVARPECSPDLRRDAARLDRWVASGVTLQIDAASSLGLHGREVQCFAMKCLQKYENYAVIASNANATNYNRSSLGKAREVLTGKLGVHRTQRHLRDLPSAIVDKESEAGRASKSPGRLAVILRTLRQSKALTDVS